MQEVAAATVDELTAVEGLEPERAAHILAGARQIAEELSKTVVDLEGDRVTDIDQLILPEEVKKILMDSGYDSIQSLAAVSEEELSERTGLRPDETHTVCSATEAFLRFQKSV